MLGAVLPFALALLGSCDALATLNSRAQADLVTSLPGLNFNFSPRQFSGYVSAAPNRHLHYWMVESQGDPDTDPLIVWFNGGPGCSSFNGLFTEQGFAHVNKDTKTLFQNNDAWSKVGNMLYLEGPTRVGFSYSDNFADDVTNDTRTGSDFAAAIADFVASVRPDMLKRPLFLTGESYAGVYIPITASYLLKMKAKGTFKGNLQGLMIGNGILSEKLQHNSVVDFMYFHGVIGSQLWQDLKASCCPSTCTAQCDFYSHLKLWLGKGNTGNDWSSDGSKCGNLTYRVSELLLWSTQNDAYNLYQDCYQTKTSFMERQRAYGLWLPPSHRRPEPVSAAQFASTQAAAKSPQFSAKSAQLATNLSPGKIFNPDSTDANSGFACWGDYTMRTYLNRPDVWNALHIPAAVTSNPAFNKSGWEDCSSFVGYTFNRTEREMDKWFQDLLYHHPSIRFLIYNGDVDMVCNFLGDEWFMDKQIKAFFPRTSVGPRGPWFYRGAIAGYVQSWSRIDVATVKGAGHMVPKDRPGPSLQLLANFVRGTGNYSAPFVQAQTPNPKGPASGAAGTRRLSLAFLIPALYLIL